MLNTNEIDEATKSRHVTIEHLSKGNLTFNHNRLNTKIHKEKLIGIFGLCSL